MSKHQTLELYIDGEWRAARGGIAQEVLNPATEEVIALVPQASREDIDDAIASTARGFELWRATPAFERARVMQRGADLIRERVAEIAATVTAEQGKPLAEARSEVLRAADMVEFCAQEGRRLYGRVIPSREPNVQQFTIKEPVGPVAGLTPWNFPANSPCRKIGGALAAGCSLVLKPSEEVPCTAVELVRAMADAGLPAGVLNLVLGKPAAISQQLIESPVIRAVAFTGSVPVGKQLSMLAAQHMKPMIPELGGHAPVIVCDDVDPLSAGKACAAGKFRNAGQICTSPTRFFVHRSIYDRFADAFASAAAGIRVGNGAEQGTEMGPLANRRRLEAVSRYVNDAVEHGARLLAGGKRIGERGFFYAPTVLADAPDTALAMNEEPFGPLALLVAYDDLDEAIARANRLAYGLAAYAFTNSASKAAKIYRGLECGVIGINRFTVSDPETPFGGVKDSGYGRQGGVEGMEGYVTTKFVAHAL